MMSEMQQRPMLKSLPIRQQSYQDPIRQQSYPDPIRQQSYQNPIRQHSFQDPDDDDQQNVMDIEQRIFLARRASEPPDARKAVMGEFAT